MSAEPASTTDDGSELAWLVRARISTPALASPLVPRARLHIRMANLIKRHPAVFVEAAAGSGKTTAVVQAIRRLERRPAWLTLDDTDVAPGRLLAYLQAAVAVQVPAAAAAARAALTAGVTLREAAGILVEAASQARLVLVIDELERLAEAPEALSVIDALLRYAPPDMRLVLVSRQELSLDVQTLILSHRAVRVQEPDLAFTPEEAAEALQQAGRPDIDPERAVAATGGWVTGVLLEALHSGQHPGSSCAGAGLSSTRPPLYEYLSRNVLEPLDREDRDFLVETALLPLVTADGAAALGQRQAAARLWSLRGKHLPVAWETDPVAMRCHPRFREYLLDVLGRENDERLASLNLAYGRLLEREGHDEEAVEALLAAGDTAEALRAAERCIVPVVERLDLATADRWLAALADVRPMWSAGLTTAELLRAMLAPDVWGAVRIGDRLAEAGERERLAAACGYAAALLAWAYLSNGRADDARSVLQAAPPCREVDAVRHALRTFWEDEEVAEDAAARPALPGGPLDVLVMAAGAARGSLRWLADHAATGWATRTSKGARIAALQALGETTGALELYESEEVSEWWAPMAVQGAELMHDVGRVPEARRLLDRAREAAAATGALTAGVSAEIVEARLELRLERSPATARQRLDRVERNPITAGFPWLREQVDTWYGLALLLEHDDGEARRRLRRAVEGLRRGGRDLTLPAAAVYLAEAEWRAGDEEAADEAADVALAAATRMGSNHLLLQALSDFPAVLSRRLDAEPTADSAWHVIGRALRARGAQVELPAPTASKVLEFGELGVLAEGALARPVLTKSHTLLAYLASRPGAAAARGSVLSALFEEGAGESALAYLRQAVRRAREMLPSSVQLVADEKGVRLEPARSLTSESVCLEAMLAESSRSIGEERLDRIQRALELYDRGPYLLGTSTPWADERRRYLDLLVEQALVDAAGTTFDLERYGDAERFVRLALARNPYLEAGWRLLMRVAGALGDQDGVIDAYRRCEQVLVELGAAPSQTTRKLIDQLRR